MLDQAQTKHSVWVAIVVDVVVTIVKFIAALVTGSSSMLSEAIHSTVDTGNDVFLYIGGKRSKQPADATHPFGHGKELYFWTLIVALSIFAVGGGVSIYEGIQHLIERPALENPQWNYTVLGISAVLETISGWSAYREFREGKTSNKGVWASFRATHDPTTYTVLFEQIAALAGLLFAAAGIVLTEKLGNPIYDGLGSIAIGTVLCVVAYFLIQESKELLIGEAVPQQVMRRIRQIVAANEKVDEVLKILSMVVGPREILLAMDVKFRPRLSTDEIVLAIDELEQAIRSEYAEISRIFIEVESLSERKRPAV